MFVTGNYSRRSDIATGRFLRDFEDQWALLDDVDQLKLKLARRGPGWVQVHGPYVREPLEAPHASV